MISGDGLFKCRTVRRVVREEAFNQKWIEEAVTPLDEYVQKGAKTSFDDVRVHRHVVEGHAPIPEAPGRAFVPRRARLSQKDFDDFRYRIEADLIKTDGGKARLGKSKDRIDHWIAKSGEVMLADQDKDE